MRHTLSFLTLLACMSTLSAQSRWADSDITAVTVYRNGALVNRSFEVNVPAGSHKVIVDGISSTADLNNVQVSISSNVTLLSVSQAQGLMKDSETNELNARIRKLEEAIEYERINAKALEEDLALLNENRQIKGSNANLTPAELEEFSNYYKGRIIENRLAIKESLSTVDSLSSLIKQLKLGDSSRDKPEHQGSAAVVLQVDANSTAKVKGTLTYIVRNVTWATTYDMKVKSLDEPAVLVYKAETRNMTENRWEDVKLTFSTGNPMRSITPPTLFPWRIGPIATPVIEEVPDALLSEYKNVRGQVRAEADEAGALGISARENVTALEFTIDQTFTIPTGNEGYTVELRTEEIDAEYRYSAVPKLSKYAYLQAYIPDWESLLLSQGQVKVFIDNSYQGASWLNPNTIKDTLAIPMGVDIAVSIEREKIKSFTDKKGFGKKYEKIEEWKITIRNQKSTDINIVVYDQIPLSTFEDVEVKAYDLVGAKMKINTGIVEWELDVPKGGSKSKELKYSVKYPKDMEIGM